MNPGFSISYLSKRTGGDARAYIRQSEVIFHE
jgi:hypothetical protein